MTNCTGRGAVSWLVKAFAPSRLRGALRPRPRALSSPPDDAQQPSTARTGSAERSALSVFAEIDRGILSGVSSERIVQQAVRRAVSVMDCEALAVTLLEPDAEIESRTWWATREWTAEPNYARCHVEARRFELLAALPDGCWSDTRNGGIPALLSLPGERLLQLPVFRDSELAAVVSVAVSSVSALTAERRACARDFADRLGVAITAGSRGENLRAEEHYDSVTRLPNRRLLQQRLSEEIARARRARSEFAVMFVGLDNFAKINENVGHFAGDAVLEMTASRIRTCLREQDIVGRFGGDEFVAVLPAINGSLGARAAAEKILAVFAPPFRTGEHEHHVGASIGVCIYPHDGNNIEALLRCSSSALSGAKEQGRGQFVFFTEKMNTQVSAHATIERDLRQALVEDHLLVMYQPQIDLRSGKLVAAEALVRWEHPERGLISPADFIAIAEHSGLIEDIGDFVRRAVCHQYRLWSEAGIAPDRISVNVSAREIRRADFVERLAATLAETGVRPYSLELEITETLLVDQSEHALRTLQCLHDRGFRIALDDFGTGYSCLSYLKSVPFDVLKIDRAFVKDIGVDDASDAIITAIARMAQSLGKEVVCEGVETERQRKFLADLGCDLGQGYLWSGPKPAHAFTEVYTQAA